MANKVSTQSYLIKRLRDSGYNIIKLDSISYNDGDNRKWTILLDNAIASVLITCMKDGALQLYDGNRFVKNTKLKIDTDSVEVLIEFLNACGIVNKHRSYKSLDLDSRMEVE
jgi:hypothetical protein